MPTNSIVNVQGAKVSTVAILDLAPIPVIFANDDVN
jgi:hypothetical protein